MPIMGLAKRKVSSNGGTGYATLKELKDGLPVRESASGISKVLPGESRAFLQYGVIIAPKTVYKG